VNGTMIDARWERLQEILEAFRDMPGPLIQVLHQAQDLFGYLSEDVQRAVAAGLALPPSTVHGVVTFYNFFRTEPVGEHIISVCTGTACHVKGAERVLSILKECLGVEEGQTTSDGRFTVQGVRCIGACGLAPAMMVDDEVYGKLDRARVEDVLSAYR
jgi:NADH:ubiquinone oxidoreductase subunit E